MAGGIGEARGATAAGGGVDTFDLAFTARTVADGLDSLAHSTTEAPPPLPGGGADGATHPDAASPARCCPLLHFVCFGPAVDPSTAPLPERFAAVDPAACCPPLLPTTTQGSSSSSSTARPFSALGAEGSGDVVAVAPAAPALALLLPLAGAEVGDLLLLLPLSAVTVAVAVAVVAAAAGCCCCCWSLLPCFFPTRRCCSSACGSRLTAVATAPVDDVAFGDVATSRGGGGEEVGGGGFARGVRGAREAFFAAAVTAIAVALMIAAAEEVGAAGVAIVV